eukprot:1776154-Pleurochrysis_carterae.AAC.2
MYGTVKPSAAALARRTRIASGRRAGTAMRGVRDEAQRESNACIRREDAYELVPVRRRSTKAHSRTSAASKPAASGGERSNAPSTHSCLAPAAMAALRAATLRRIDRRVQEDKCQGAFDLSSSESTSRVGGGRSHAVPRAARDASCSRMGHNSPAAGSQSLVDCAGGDETLRDAVVSLRTDAERPSSEALRSPTCSYEGATTDVTACDSTGRPQFKLHARDRLARRGSRRANGLDRRWVCIVVGIHGVMFMAKLFALSAFGSASGR